MTNPTSKLVFISAAEPSADRHAAALVRAVHERDPSIQFVGLAGPRMVEAGCHRVYDLSRHAAMLLGVVQNLARGATALAVADRCLRRFAFSAVVVVDSPTLHLPLTAKARALGIPVLYYVAPQLWAWGAYRIYKLRHRVDRLAVILPFEEEFFRNQGVDATFVGHPLAEQIHAEKADESVVAALRRRGRPVVALLPGSRRHVVETVLPGQLEVAGRIAEEIRTASFVVSAANPQVRPVAERSVRSCSLPIEVCTGPYGHLLRAADLVLVASGTAALEVAFYERPMIVMYNTSPVFYHLIGRWMIRTPHLALPNILAQRQIVPEFMPYYRSTDPIARTALELLRSEEGQRQMTDALRAIVQPLRQTCASQRTAELLLDMIARTRR